MDRVKEKGEEKERMHERDKAEKTNGGGGDETYGRDKMVIGSKKD